MMKYSKCILKLETVQKFLNLGLMELVPIIYVILLFSLMLDRYLAARDPSKYRKSSETTKHRLYILLYWIFSIISVSPLISGSVANYPFPDRYSCQVRVFNKQIKSLSKSNTMTSFVVYMSSISYVLAPESCDIFSYCLLS